MNEVQGTLEVAKGISDLGVLIIIGAAFIVLSLGMWVALFRWFKSIMDNVIKNNSATMSALLTKTDAQNDVLNEIADGLRPSTLLQIKNISNTCFDLSTEKVCRIIKRCVRKTTSLIRRLPRLKSGLCSAISTKTGTAVLTAPGIGAIL